jgi:PAS domain S-box-containing protein
MNGAKNCHLAYLDQEFNFVRVNETFATSCGHSPENLVGENHFTLFPHVENQAIFTRVRDTGIASESHDKPFSFPDQPERGVTYWDWTLTPDKDEAGNVLGLVLALFETTDRVKAEEAVRESEERLRLLGDNLPESAVYQYSYNPTGDSKFIYVSAGIERIRGVSVQDVLSDGGALRRQILPEYQDKVTQEEKRSIKELSDFDMDVPVRLPDGQLRWLALHSRPRRMPDGRTVWNGVQTDITERKRKEEELRRLAQFPGENPNPVLRIESNGMLMSANTPGQTWLASFGWEHNGPLPDAVCSAVSKALSLSQVFECEISNSDGEAFAFTAIQPAGEDYVNLYGKDVTARKQMEEELRRSNEKLEEEVRKRTATLTSLNEELENRAEQLRRLAGELTMTEQRERKRLAKTLHDGLQQYLVAAKLQIDTLIHPLNDPGTNQTAKDIEYLLAEAVRVSRTLAAEISPPILYDASFLSSLEWLSRWMSDKHGLKVQLNMEPMDAPRFVDDVKTFLFEAVRELLLNVVKHAKTKNATIHLTHQDNRLLQITVSDSGRGFDASATISGDLDVGGLGLFSIRERISLIGGKFEYDSAPGKGARFTMTAPLSTPMQEKDNSSPIPQGRDGQCVSALDKGRHIRVLLADDHAVMREGLARLLAQEPDLAVVGHANDGCTAVSMAATLLPDVILMDISMPGMNGIEATKIIHQQHPNIHIVGLSLYTASERANEILDAGATFFISKSGPSADLKAAIRSCMKQRQPITETHPGSQRTEN